MKQTQNQQVPWEHSALTGRFYFSAGIHPAAFTGTTAQGLFNAKRYQEVKALAEKYQLALPDFDIEVPAANVAVDMRRFVGIWVSEPTADRRSNMLIVSRVARDGKLDGYWLHGPPAPNSRLKYPASLFPFAGTITDSTLRFQSPDGSAKYRFTLTKENTLDYVFSSARGESANRTFTPFWTLVQAQAERSASKAPQKPPAAAKELTPAKKAEPRPPQ
jgi:hypothetical protein